MSYHWLIHLTAEGFLWALAPGRDEWTYSITTPRSGWGWAHPWTSHSLPLSYLRTPNEPNFENIWRWPWVGLCDFVEWFNRICNEYKYRFILIPSVKMLHSERYTHFDFDSCMASMHLVQVKCLSTYVCFPHFHTFTSEQI